MAKLLLRVALCAAFLVCCGSVWAGGEVKDTTAPKVKTTPAKGRESKIHVHLPTTEAKVYFDDTLAKTETGKKDREFCCPALEEGKRYTYKVVVVWVENGREVTHETKIEFKAGDDVVVDFRR